LLRCSGGPDLIVTGNHGKGAVAGRFTRSFTGHLLKVALRPVLVVPGRPHHEPETPN
jgi:nucleotide-binding universal stress UspA family protein